LECWKGLWKEKEGIGSKEHVMGGLGIYDIYEQQRIDYVSSTVNVLLNRENPAKAWLRLLFCYDG
jgi:hypothetical protein